MKTLTNIKKDNIITINKTLKTKTNKIKFKGEI
jgi:hypothetical protein